MGYSFGPNSMSATNVRKKNKPKLTNDSFVDKYHGTESNFHKESPSPISYNTLAPLTKPIASKYTMPKVI